MGECDLEDTGDPSISSVIHNVVVLVRMFPTFDLISEENAARQ